MTESDVWWAMDWRHTWSDEVPSSWQLPHIKLVPWIVAHHDSAAFSISNHWGFLIQVHSLFPLSQSFSQSCKLAAEDKVWERAQECGVLCCDPQLPAHTWPWAKSWMHRSTDFKFITTQTCRLDYVFPHVKTPAFRGALQHYSRKSFLFECVMRNSWWGGFERIFGWLLCNWFDCMKQRFVVVFPSYSITVTDLQHYLSV